MAKNIKIVILICSLLLTGYSLFGQKGNNQKIRISITQNISPGPNPIFVYKISHNKFAIERTKRIIWQTIKYTELTYSKKLNKPQKDSLAIVINSIDFSKLENSYTSNMLDGIDWTFEIKTNDVEKTVSLWNYYLPDLGYILDFINRQFPRANKIISFDYLDIKNQTIKK